MMSPIREKSTRETCCSEYDVSSEYKREEAREIDEGNLQ
jgi:hypothetical protein